MRARLLFGLIAAASVLLPHAVSAQTTKPSPAPFRLFREADHAWYASVDGRRVLDNVVAWQNADGGWPKSYDASVARPDGPSTAGWHNVSTIDNGATHGEIRLLARAARITDSAVYRDAAAKGVRFLISMQYPNGGLPQRFPLDDNYGRHITLNDNAMADALRVLRDAGQGAGDFAFITPADRTAASAAFARGVDCLLRMQIIRDGQPTVWCQQHDAVTLAPVQARKYEYPSYCSAESAGVALLLMEIEQPDDRVRRAIGGAVAWFEAARITGKRFETVRGDQYEAGSDRILVDDPASTIWARFYDLETMKPFFATRDGTRFDDVMKIGREPRVGYAWFNNTGIKVTDAYAQWKPKHGAQSATAQAPGVAQVPTPATSPSTAPSATETLHVAPDGSAKFTTVQAAIDSIPANSPATHVVVIKPGTYRERVSVPKDAANITLRGDGDDASKVTIVFGLRAGMPDPKTGKPVGTSGSETVLVQGNNFTAERITFENDAGDNGQAVAVRTRGDRAVFRNCRFLGWQDTLYVNGDRHYFVDCYVEGRVDFIFGRATSVFQSCEIVSKNGGYVTAASTPVEKKHGLVFLDCVLRSADDVPTYLGRPWKPDAAVAFIRCTLGAHIRAEGWHNWGKVENEKTARFVEFGNTGPGADRTGRVGWSKALPAEEAAEYTAAKVLSGTDGWDPAK